MPATIRLCLLALPLRPVGDESCSILPTDVSQSGLLCIGKVSNAGNPLYSQTLTLKMQVSRFSRHLAHDTGIVLDKPIHPILSIAMLSFGQYVSILRSDAILLGNVTIVGPGCMVSHLLEGEKYHSGRPNLPTCG